MSSSTVTPATASSGAGKSAPTFWSKFFARPSMVSLVAEGAIVALAMMFLSTILFYGSLVLLVIVAAHRAYKISQNTPAKFAGARNVFITGATSGIGEYIAYKYAKQGAQNIYITGRNVERLGKVAKACVALNSSVTVHELQLDVVDAAAMDAAMKKADAATPLDVVYANAGVSSSVMKDVEYESMCRQVMDINVTGIFNTVFPVRQQFIERKRGQIVIIASIAGIASLPGNHPYAASKAAAISIGQGLRAELGAHGVGVTVICPGFVRSGITQERHERFGLPFFMETEPAVDIIVQGVEEDVPVVVFPFPTGFGALLLRVLPYYLFDVVSERISRRMYR